MGGCVLFKKDRSERRGDGVALHVGASGKYRALPSEEFMVRIKGQANPGDTAVGIYYRPSGQEEEGDEAFYGQRERAPWSEV